MFFNRSIKVLLGLLLCLQLVPPLQVFDITSLRHFLLAVFDLLAIVLMLFASFKMKERFCINALKTKPLLIWIGLIAIMLLSFFQAMNVIESIAVLNRWVVILLCALTTCLLMDKDNKAFDFIVYLSIIIAAINVLECLVPYYWLEVYKNQRDNIKLNGCYGNKNIFSVALLFKLPFLYYAFFNMRRLWKWFALALVFLIALCLVIISTRTSFIGLILQVVVLTAFIIHRKRKVWHGLLVTAAAILGFWSGDLLVELNYNLFSEKLSANNYALNSRFESIAEGNSKGRLIIWKNTWETIKQKPLLGHGIGNHKFAIMKVEAPKKTGWIVSDHAHNDFLEMWSELGVIGLAAYLMFAVVLLTLSFKYAFGRRYDEHWRWLALVALLCFLTYFNDAAFNFPAERASCQLYLALGVAFLLLVIVKKRAYARKRGIVLLCVLFVVILPVIYVEGSHYVSSIRQKQRILQSNGSPNVAYTFEQWVKRMPKIPNVDENCKPVIVNTASIAVSNINRFNLPKQEQYRKAIALLLCDNANPYYGLKEYRLGNYYFHCDEMDSALLWSRRCIELKPLCYDPVRVVYWIYSRGNEDVMAEKTICDYLMRCEKAGVVCDKNAKNDLKDIKAKIGKTEGDSVILQEKMAVLNENSTK